MKKAFIGTALLIGVFLALQVRSFQKVEFLVQRSGPESVFEELRIFQIANQQLKSQLEESDRLLQDIQSKIAGQTVEEELVRLQALSGLEPVFGEGIEIVMNASLPAYRLSDLIAQLVAAGAEAVAVNDIRLTPATAGLRDVAGGLLMGRHFFKPPYRIDIIGPRQDLRLSVGQNGGLLDRIQSATPGLTITLAEKQTVAIPKLPE